MPKSAGKIFRFVLCFLSAVMFFQIYPAHALWSHRFGTEWDDYGILTRASGGGFYLSMNSIEPWGGSDQQFLLFSKIDSDGAVQWTRKIYISDYDQLGALEMEDGSILVQGQTSETYGGAMETVLGKFTVDSSGVLLPVFEKRFTGGYGNASMNFWVAESGSIFGTGAVETSTGQDIWLMRVDPITGSVTQKVFHKRAYSTVSNLLEIADGYLLCASLSDDIDSSDILVAKLDSSFAKIWAKTYSGSGVNYATVEPISGGYLLLGTTAATSDPSDPVDIIAIKIDGSGNILDSGQWKKKFEGPEIKSARLVFEDAEGNLILSGNMTTTDTYQSRVFLMKLTSTGTISELQKMEVGASDTGTFIRDEDGYLFSGSSDSNLLFGRFDSDFNKIWLKTFGGTGLVSGAFSESGSQYLLSGAGNIFGSTDWDFFGITFDPDGNSPACAYLHDVEPTWVSLDLTAVTFSLPSSTTLSAGTLPDESEVAFVGEEVTISTGDACAPPPGSLSITPATGFNSSGSQGGPFSPLSREYILENTGGESIDWTASGAQAWVTLSSSGGTLAAGATVTVTVSINPEANSLAAGNYLDTLTFTNTTNGNGNTTRGVNLTVYVVPGTLSVMPGTGMNSSGAQGGPFSPSTGDYTLQNTGVTSINWTASKTQGWLTLSNNAGILGPGGWTTVTLSINDDANSLAVGSYTDTVTFANTSNGRGNTTRGVGLIVNARLGTLAVTPATEFSATGAQGGPFSPTNRDYTVQNTGVTSIDWTATKGQSWITLSTVGGTLAAGTSTTITVSINSEANSLAVGSYSDTITFTNTTNGNGNTTRGVALTVNTPPGVLSVTPATELSCSGTQGGPFSPCNQDYAIQNTGGTSINWSASKTQGWVTLSSGGGTLGAGSSTTVSVSINSGTNSLIAGSYSDTVTFANTSNGNGNTTRGVNLTVNPPPGVLSVNPSTDLLSSGTQGGPFSPSSKDYTVQNTGGTSINWTASKGQNWVTLSNTSGALAPGASVTVTVSINSGGNGLAPGSYSDTISFTNTTNGSGNTTRAVSLTVNALPGVLSVSPGDLVSSGIQGGPFSPGSKAYTLQNTGGTSINWTASKGQSWADLLNSGGTLGPGEAATVTISINSGANGFSPGTYSDSAIFTNTTNGNGNTTRGVSLTVNALPGLLFVSSGDLVSSGTQGGPFSPDSKSYTLQNTGGISVNWTASKGQPWVDLLNSGGTLAAGATATVTVSINSGANGLGPGSYSDTISITNTTNGSGNTTRGVGLTVDAVPGVLLVTPGTDFSSAGNEEGPFSPASKGYTLQNTGGTSVDWTASKGWSWLTLSSSGGTLGAGAATTVTVSINAAANSLAAGSYSDTVIFTNTTNSNGNDARGISLTVTVAPPAPRIEAYPDPADFGDVDAGGEEHQQLTISNSGTADLMISSIRFTGGESGMFDLEAGGANPCPDLTPTIPVGGSCTVLLIFTPDSEGSKSTTLSISSNDPAENPKNVTVSGNAVLSAVTPSKGTIGTLITIRGSGFGQSKGKVVLGGTFAQKVISWSDTEIQCWITKAPVPGTHDLVVQSKSGGIPFPKAFTMSAPVIETVSPGKGRVGDAASISGFHFGSKKGKVYLGGMPCKVTSWGMISATTGVSKIEFLVPKKVSPGSLDLQIVNKVGAGTESFEVIP
jgi:hypothetical protein